MLGEVLDGTLGETSEGTVVDTLGLEGARVMGLSFEQAPMSTKKSTLLKIFLNIVYKVNSLDNRSYHSFNHNTGLKSKKGPLRSFLGVSRFV